MPEVLYERGPRGLAALELPDADARVVRGVRWGRYDELFTPAYWRCQAWLWEVGEVGPTSHALGRTLAEEVAACLLGGHGIPAEVGIAAFERLRRRGLLADGGRPPTRQALAAALRAPLAVGGRSVRYRFADQKSRYLSEVLPRIADAPLPSSAPPPDVAASGVSATRRTVPGGGVRPSGADDEEGRSAAATAAERTEHGPPARGPHAVDDPAAHRNLRAWLCTLPGVGPKTASWVTRNWLQSDAVAIIDVHLYRAGVLARVFRGTEVITRDYLALEGRFLDFAAALGVSAARLDAVIWRDMRWLSAHARSRLPRGPARRPLRPRALRASPPPRDA